ncbi:MAG: pyridoxamine 5'-phosphate oxidase [Phycisphaerae bacterium]
MTKFFHDMRIEYSQRGLSEHELDADPFRQFAAWFDEAVRADLIEPNAAALASATRDGVPSVRMVLLKAVDDRGFVFYTDFNSRKGAELAANPRASACWWWSAMERQVRIAGVVERVSSAESDAYFTQRPRGSQIGANVSAQSAVLASRDDLERRWRAFDAAHAGKPIPRPASWGGFRIVPAEFEFWQGRQSRLHDRLCYRRGTAGAWEVVRLSP